MNIQQLRCFIMIVQCGSINKAASALFMSQPNLSVSLKTLENELGYALLKRDRAGIELTPEGELFLDKARELLLNFDSLHMLDDRSAGNQLFTVATMANCHATDALLRIYEQQGTVSPTVYVHTGPRQDVIDCVSGKAYRIGIVYIYEEIKSQMIAHMAAKNITAHSLAPCEAGILIGKGNPYYNTGLKEISPDDVAGQIYVSFGDKSALPYRRISQICGFTTYSSILTLSNMADVYKVLDSISSYTIVPFHQEHILSDVYNKLKIKGKKISGEFMWITRKDAVLTDIDSLFIRSLKEMLN